MQVLVFDLAVSDRGHALARSQLLTLAAVITQPLLCALAAAHIVGAYPIIAVDLTDDKLAFAQRFGATHGVNAAHGDPGAAHGP